MSAPVNGAVFYSGQSMLDGSPIVAIATGINRPSANPKTGAMVQTWIMREDMAPTAAAATGADVSICGGCPQRPAMGGGCYVVLWQAPLWVYKAFRSGRYPKVPAAWIGELCRLQGRPLRIGSYGDPAAVPVAVWERALEGAPGRTGYSHQWARLRSDRWRNLLMASCDSTAELELARARGWRAFLTVDQDTERPPKGAVWCPASPEGGRRATCATCQLCQGARVQAADVAIRVHGAAAGRHTANLTTIGRKDATA